MNVSVVIPNYNGKFLLQKNLPKVLRVLHGAEVIVSDDASTDGSISFLHSQFPSVRVVSRKKNEGFASTVNDGVSLARGEFVFLLNSDAYPEPHILDSILPHFSDPLVFGVGISQKCYEGERIVMRGRGIGTFRSGFLFHERGEIASSGSRSGERNDTLWISAGAGVFRKTLWDTFGGLQTLYNPFYWEDIDLSYRARKAGYRIVFESRRFVIHEQSEGSIRTFYSAHHIQSVAYRNQFLFVWLNISTPRFLVSHFLHVPRYVLRAFFSRDRAFLSGFSSALMRLPNVFGERKKNAVFWKKRDEEIFVSS